MQFCTYFVRLLSKNNQNVTFNQGYLIVVKRTKIVIFNSCNHDKLINALHRSFPCTFYCILISNFLHFRVFYCLELLVLFLCHIHISSTSSFHVGCLRFTVWEIIICLIKVFCCVVLSFRWFDSAPRFACFIPCELPINNQSATVNANILKY